MSKYSTVVTASVVAVLTAGGLAARITMQKKDFDKTVKEALKTSEGYDQKFIDMVNRLERELALRASFGYSGGKDPMTGKERTVVMKRHSRRRRTKEVEHAETEIDSVKLTAIIYDDDKELYTAIIMVGERSFAIETGDIVVGRRVSRISDAMLVMEDNQNLYVYDIVGNLDKRQK